MRLCVQRPSVSQQRRSPRKIKLPAVSKAVSKALAFSSPTVTHVIDPTPPTQIVGEVRELAAAIVVPPDQQTAKVVDDDFGPGHFGRVQFGVTLA